MNFRQIVQDYFTFSRNERKGITILMVLIFMLAIANKTIFYFEKPDKMSMDLLNKEFIQSAGNTNSTIKSQHLFQFDPNRIDQTALDTLALPEGIKKNMMKYRERGGIYKSVSDFRKMYGMTDSIFLRVEPFIQLEKTRDTYQQPAEKKRLFNFDPNTASDHTFQLLGITEKQIRTIRNYQQKGGTFKDSRDFMKLYGISESQKKELMAYVVIEKNEKFTDNAPLNLIELNETDSIELKTLPGIGDKLSKRIVKYRDLLGGFYSAEQLKEIYGLSASTIEIISGRITFDPLKIKKVDLNFSDRYELSRHPYIGKKISEKIIKFRSSYGKISDPLVLKDSMILSIEEYERLKPYL